ncbi:nuclease PIN [uncultured Rothia sp.]|uniref:nuclease PIN n=1 Tax=uncultured Rothia sp. TaxID=316088 RepID=UPI003217D689
MRESAVWHMTTTARPHEIIQKNLQTVAVPVRGGYSAVSIQDYTRVTNERSEFLNFLLSPNPSGVPATEYGVLRAA